LQNDKKGITISPKMGKNLLLITLCLTIVIISPVSVIAIYQHAVTDISIHETDDGAKSVKISVQMPNEDIIHNEVFTSLVAPDISHFFETAEADGVPIDCAKSATSIDCNKKYQKVSYTFKVVPSDILLNRFCHTVSAEKDTQNISKRYFTNFWYEPTDSRYFVHKVSIDKIIADAGLGSLYADISSETAFATLLVANSLSDTVSIDSLHFVSDKDAPPASRLQNMTVGTYRPISGGLEKFTEKGKIETFFLDTSGGNMTVSSVKYILCDRADVNSQSLKSEISHRIIFSDDSVSATEFSELLITFSDISLVMENDLDVDNVIVVTPTPTPSIESPPIATINIISSVDSPTISPTPSIASEVTSSIAVNSPTAQIAVNSELANDLTGQVLGSEDDKQDRVEHVDGDIRKEKRYIGEIKSDDVSTARFIILLVWSCTVMLIFTVIWKLSPLRRRVLSKIKELLSITLCLIFFMIVVEPQYAQGIPISQKITDGSIMHGTGQYTGVMNLAHIYATKSLTPGRYVISSNPDGTGDVKIGNYLQAQLQHSYWNSKKSLWIGPSDGPGKHYVCPNETVLPPQNADGLFFAGSGSHNMTFRFITSCYTNFPVSDLYLVFIPLPTPTYTSTPTPTPVGPFLDLPWDYKAKGLTFSQAAMSMTSFFDHEYPLLSASVVGLSDVDDLLRIYKGEKDDYSYSSHDGYDYARLSSAFYGDPQLSSADGTATFHKNTWHMGNAIFIDHHNGYQTRYYHLDDRDLITNQFNNKIVVKQGQMIGRIGYTGNVDPEGIDGAHIHFMVVFDKNRDGSFDDNIPDGLVDPYGWSGEVGTDPWENAVFQQPFGVDKTGIGSRYLWQYPLVTYKSSVGPEGGDISADGVMIKVPKLTLDQILDFHIKSVPQSPTSMKSDGLESIGSATEIIATDSLGRHVRYFNNPFSVIIDLFSDVAKYYDPTSIDIYTSSDGGQSYEKAEAVIDWENKKIIATVNHLTIFTVMGQRIDKSPPDLDINLSGFGKGNHFRSDVDVKIESDDTGESLGIAHTLFAIDSDVDWREYTEGFQVLQDGPHEIKSFSVDKSGNVSAIENIDFTIDKKAPEIRVKYSSPSADFDFGIDHGDSFDGQHKGDIEVGEIMVAKLGEDIVNVRAEDVSGNLHEAEFVLSKDHGQVSLSIKNIKVNGDVNNLQKSLYGYIPIGRGHEIVKSTRGTVRVVTDEGGNRLFVQYDGTFKSHTNNDTLHLVTGDGILTIDKMEVN
jgi:murein DD-endopeptidase MepM/ murein hydrolase activator NlpD